MTGTGKATTRTSNIFALFMLKIFLKSCYPRHGTHSSDEHAQVGARHHVTVTDCGHRDQRPPQAWRQHFNNVSTQSDRQGREGGGYSS